MEKERPSEVATGVILLGGMGVCMHAHCWFRLLYKGTWQNGDRKGLVGPELASRRYQISSIDATQSPLLTIRTTFGILLPAAN